jgi:hypothetical protein
VTSTFDLPDPRPPVIPVTIHDDGSVGGYLALWNTPHQGWGAAGRAVYPPRYASLDTFHTTQVHSISGSTRQSFGVGLITFGGHPSDDSLTASGAADWYGARDCLAFVRAHATYRGLWLQGRLAPRAKAPTGTLHVSGDWRPVGGHQISGLVGCAVVAKPGFPIRHEDRRPELMIFLS